MQYTSKQTQLAGDIYDYKLQVFSLVENVLRSLVFIMNIYV